jgi:hypothetical protein
MTALSLLPSVPTLLGPLTTTFTPPPQCFRKTAACEPNGIPHQFYTGGFAYSSWIAEEFQRTECYPDNYPAIEGGGFFPQRESPSTWPLRTGTLGPYFSPGTVCPVGYATATTEELPVESGTAAETRAICCVEGLTFNATHGCFFRTPVPDPIPTTVWWTTDTADEFFFYTYSDPKPEVVTTKTKTNVEPDYYGSVIEIRWQASDTEHVAVDARPTVTPAAGPEPQITSISGQSEASVSDRTSTSSATDAVISNSIFSGDADGRLAGDVKLKLKLVATLGALAVLVCI